MKNETLIIIPAYNESKTIGTLLDSIIKSDIHDFADVLVINDASNDDTSTISKCHGASVVTNVFNLGYGSALQVGYKYAIRKNYKYVIQMDADGQHDVCNIKYIHDELINDNTYDIIIGSRFLPGSVNFKMKHIKIFAIKFFRYVIQYVTNIYISDPTSGLQGLQREAFLYYSKYNNFDSRYPDANMLIQMLLMGYKVKEIPAVMHGRETGTSMHTGLKPILYMVLMIISMLNVILRYYLKQKRLKKSNSKP